VTISSHDDTGPLRKILHRNHVGAGCSSPVGWPELQVGLQEAHRAAGRASPERPFVRFEELASEGMLGLLEAAGGPAIARRVLMPLLSRPAAERERLIAAVSVWLANNCAWDPAARQLGVHRHTLRHRVTAVAKLLALDLDQFADRAELWAALRMAMHDAAATSPLRRDRAIGASSAGSPG
jgi:purine catabolism regulator